MDPLDCLLRYPLLALLGRSPVAAWLAGGEEITFAAGETVFQEGSEGAWAYLVLDGRVRVVGRTEGGREVSLGLAGAGELFGEYALLPPHTNTAACRAAGPTRVFRLPLAPLRSAYAPVPAVAGNLKRWLRLHALVRYLRGQCFLGFMTGPSALALLDHTSVVEFDAVRTVQADGLGADRWYYIDRGQVSLHPAAGAPDEPTRRLGPGDCFGERALLGLDGLPVAITLSPTSCRWLPRVAFDPSSAGEASGFQTANPHRDKHRPAYPWVGQQGPADCGVAALAMVARALGLEVAAESLRRQVRLGERGASLLGLRQAAAGLGLWAETVRISPGQLDQVGLPAVAHLRDGHFVVLYEQGERGVVVGDPATGVVTLSRGLFLETWSGNLLMVHRNENC